MYSQNRIVAEDHVGFHVIDPLLFFNFGAELLGFITVVNFIVLVSEMYIVLVDFVLFHSFGL